MPRQTIMLGDSFNARVFVAGVDTNQLPKFNLYQYDRNGERIEGGEIDTLPVDSVVEISGGKSPLTAYPRKIAKAVVEMSNSYNAQVNSNDVIITTVSDLNNADTIASFTGKKTVFFLGYSDEPNMTITQSVPLPLRILAITSEIYY